ncbi:MAG: FkbM family methyltransferase [Verrucomicrobia bacterium]|nr:FkbM family methyltransferase [Verrucomicrobiota bacterium]
MKAFLKSILQRFPNLFVVLKPMLTAFRILLLGPGANACVACFADIRHCSEKQLDRILGHLDKSETIQFVQIGANDGKLGDPIYRYASSSAKWRGVLVEPIGYLHARLKENYSNRNNLVFEKVLVSASAGIKSVFFVDTNAFRDLDGLPAWAEGLGSVSADNIVGHLGTRIKPYIGSESIETITLQTLLQRNAIRDLDLLVIDTEGHEWVILRQLRFATLKPKVIIVEFKHLGYWSCYALIRKLRKYYRIMSNGDDLIAVDAAMPNICAD